MRLLHSPSPPPLAFSKPISSFPFNPNSIFFSSTKPLKSRRKSIPIPLSSPPNPLPLSQSDILDSIVAGNDDNDMTKKSLPGVRAYENDLARLNLIGEVGFEQAVTAAAADGGLAADEHIEGGVSTMVVETVFPGPHDERSTVSTRLFLPAQKVREKARKLINTLPSDMLSGTTSKNILAMTFRQVVLQQIWSFELVSFGPGAERNMEDLGSPREIPAFFSLSSPDGQALSILAEAICMLALESTERDFHEENSLGMARKNIMPWVQTPRKIASKDFSISIDEISQDEIVANAKKLVENLNMKGSSGLRESKKNHHWWKASTYRILERIGGPEFVTWTNEYLPVYRLQIDADKLKNLKLEGWKNSAKNRWEVLLTHSQMVGLADVLDMYYEDIYTVPDKQLCLGIVLDIRRISKSKSLSFGKILSVALASGFFVFSCSIFAQFYWPQLKVRRSGAEHNLVTQSEINCCNHLSLEPSEMEGLCISTLKKIKDAIGWPGDIVADKDGAWMGELPSFLSRLDDAGPVREVLLSDREGNAMEFVDGKTLAVLASALGSPSDKNTTALETSAQEIVSYQVALSKDGEIVGLQPMNPLAANYWESNPLKELYSGQKRSPGPGECSLEIPFSNEIVLIELLVSLNPESWFALARPVHRSC